MIHDDPYVDRYVGRVETIKVESDERGFELHVLTEAEGLLILNIHGVAVDLYNEVVKNIGPWIAEGLEARATMPDHDLEPGYDMSDPKHPRFLEGADLLRDRMRGK